MTADWHETAAYEGGVGCCIECRELAHRIDQQHLRARPHRRQAAPPVKGDAMVRQQRSDPVESPRMPRDQHQ
jgi:hypothetical protein